MIDIKESVHFTDTEDGQEIIVSSANTDDLLSISAEHDCCIVFTKEMAINIIEALRRLSKTEEVSSE